HVRPGAAAARCRAWSGGARNTQIARAQAADQEQDRLGLGRRRHDHRGQRIRRGARRLARLVRRHRAGGARLCGVGAERQARHPRSGALMWSWLASLISGPLIKSALDAYNAKLKAGNTTDKIAADLALRELDVQARELEAQSALKIAEIGRWYEPEKLFAYVTLVFYGKVLLWDKVLALGSTDAVTGEVAHWAGAIMAFYFGKRGIENVARIVGNRFGGR